MSGRSSGSTSPVLSASNSFNVPLRRSPSDLMKLREIPVVPMSVPEPAPKNEGVPITPLLIRWVDQLSSDTLGPPLNDVKADTIALIRARDNFGYNKYTQHLMSQDGRNSVEDARQELGDLLQYLFKAKHNGEDISSVVQLLPVLLALADAPTGTN